MSNLARSASLGLVLVSLLAGGCGAGSPAAADGGPAFDGPATDAPVGADAGGPAEPAACVESCASAADCASTAATLDADNWACEASRCRYLGCAGDAECQATFGTAGGTWICR